MTAPAITAALAAVLSKVEAIVPTVDPQTPFRRGSEKTPPSTRAPKRILDLEAGGHPRDLSNEGAGVQTVGRADRIAAVDLRIEYSLGRNEKSLETTMMVDSELVLRALGRSANWAGTPVQRVVATTTIDRSNKEPVAGGGAGTLVLVVSCRIQYRDTED